MQEEVRSQEHAQREIVIPLPPLSKSRYGSTICSVESETLETEDVDELSDAEIVAGNISFRHSYSEDSRFRRIPVGGARGATRKPECGKKKNAATYRR